MQTLCQPNTPGTLKRSVNSDRRDGKGVVEGGGGGGRGQGKYRWQGVKEGGRGGRAEYILSLKCLAKL